jgi:predicted negative regulator of RcsB-dependent stress response
MDVSAYSDQEEWEKFKAWWKDYGTALMIGVLIGISVLVGTKYWTEYQEERRQAASEIYANMLQQVRDVRLDQARAQGETLLRDYDGTPYAGQAALMLARISFEAKNTDEARRFLAWASDNATDPAVEHTARLRLARLHLDGGAHEQALALILTDSPGFDAEYLELKGDILVAQGKADEARAAYNQALTYAKAETPHGRQISMKLEDLGAAPKQ